MSRPTDKARWFYHEEGKVGEYKKMGKLRKVDLKDVLCFS